MPDTMLPQVAPAPAPKNAPVKSAKEPEKVTSGPDESSKDQGFSSVLKKRMETGDKPSQAAADAPAQAEVKPQEAESTAVANPADNGQDGKALPATGKLAEAILAALEADPEQLSTQNEAPSELEPLPVALSTLLQGLSIESSKTAGTESKQTGRMAWLQGRLNAWAALQSQEGQPAMDKSAIAQAVREALADSDLAFDDAVLARLGTDIRNAVLASQTQKPGSLPVDAIFDRLQLSSASSTNNSTPNLPLQTTAPQEAAARPLPTTSIEVPFRQPGWGQALSERVVWVVNQKLQGAEIKLNPPQLGPIEVRIQMHQDQAQVSFTAHHASVREALEAALPRLREMFAANGLDLGDVNVSQHSFAEQQRQMQDQMRDSGDGKFHARGTLSEQADGASLLEQGVSQALGVRRSAIDLFV